MGKKKIQLYTLEESWKLMYPDPVERAKHEKIVEKERQKIRKRYAATLARRIRKAREKSNITQAQLAKRLHTQPSAISRIESGKQNISIDYLEKICEAIGRPYRIKIEID